MLYSGHCHCITAGSNNRGKDYSDDKLNFMWGKSFIWKRKIKTCFINTYYVRFTCLDLFTYYIINKNEIYPDIMTLRENAYNEYNHYTVPND